MPLLHAIAIAALVGLLAFVGGCVRGERSGTDDRAALMAQVHNANGNVDACAASLKAMQQLATKELDKAEKQAEAGQRALEGVVRENLSLAAQVGEVELQQALARQEPTCRAQLEVELCPSVPLL